MCLSSKSYGAFRVHVSRKHRLENVDNEVNRADDEMDIDFNGNDELPNIFGQQ